MIVSNKDVHRLFVKASLCMAFRCLPSQLRKEDPDELNLIADTIQRIEIKKDPVNRMFGSK